MTIIDLRNKIKAPTRFSTFKRTSPLLGVTLHRTACRLGEDESRWHNELDPSQTLDAHIGVTMGGQVFMLQPFELGIWHGNGLSLTTVGIEFDGNPAGFFHPNGKPYFWVQGGGPDPVTDAMLAASSELFDAIQAGFEDLGVPWLGVYAHRQSSRSRESDPGVEVWQKIGVPWRERLSCDPTQIEWHTGDGQAIPREWDAKATKGFWT
jgi:hypothetical protein